MDFAVLIGFIACAVVLALTIDVSGSTVTTVGGMFHAPDLGWPRGVQEDDDLHWSWVPGAPGAPSAPVQPGHQQRMTGPELEEVDPRSTRLQLQPIRRGSH